MPILRKIAFFSILFASMVLFAHAIIPHHHHAAEGGFCLEPVTVVSDCCDHAPADAGEGLLLSETHDCGHCKGIGCSPTLPFKLGHSAEFGSEILPAVILLASVDLLNLILAEAKAELTPSEPHLTSEYVLSSLPRRAPPVSV